MLYTPQVAAAVVGTVKMGRGQDFQDKTGCSEYRDSMQQALTQFALAELSTACLRQLLQNCKLFTRCDSS